MRQKLFFKVGLFLLLFSGLHVRSQSAGFNTTYIVLNNGNGDTFYDLQATTANPDFDNAQLGTYCAGSSGLFLKGAEHNNWKCGGCDISSTHLYYRVYLVNGSSGAFSAVGLNFTSDFANGCGGRDQQWSATNLNVDLTSTLSPGNYVLEVYSDQVTSCAGTQYASNNGANFKANFTINAVQTYYVDADGDGFGVPYSSTTSCLGAPVGYVANTNDCNDNQLQYVDADGDGFGSTTLTGCGVSNAADCDDSQLQYLDFDGDGFGNAILVACGVTNASDCNDNQLQYLDADGDGYGSQVLVACGASNNVDCNDGQIQYLDVDEDGFGRNVWVACGVTNNIDCNDNELQYADADGDGYGGTTLAACGPNNNSDCNDNQLQYQDADGDGFGRNVWVACGVTNNIDCNDNELQYVDADGDGYGGTTLAACGPNNNSDCNDNQLQYQDADGDGFGRNVLVACGVTNNIDCNDNELQYVDADGDGYGSTTFAACGPNNNSDCNDFQLQYIDADGDGFGRNVLVACGVVNNVDCNDNELQYVDADGDGYGSTTFAACGPNNNSDCNDFQLQYMDADGDGFGRNVLVACGVINNIDCNDNELQYVDADGDGYGSTTFAACGPNNNSDCNDFQLQYMDADGDGFGRNVLVACGVTNNIDCNDNELQYVDADGDGYGSTTFAACGPNNHSDCNDNQLQYMDADGDGFGRNVLVACGVVNNNDCNDNQLQYVDADGDGFGSMIFAPCGVANNFDCNDANPIIGAGSPYFRDADGDGFGDSMVSACQFMAGYVTNNTDCDDTRANVNPGSVDVCYDGLDNDCNGNIDNIGLPGGCIPVYTTPAATVPNSTITYGASIITSLVANAQGYRYVVTRVNPSDNTPMSTPVTVDMGLRNLFLSNLSNYAYGAKYKVESTVRINNVWQPNYAPAFYVFTPTPLSTVASCGVQIANTTTQVTSSAVALVSVYRYQVQRLDASNNVVSTQVLTSGLRYFSFDQVTDFLYDANYSVSCAIRNLDGVFMAYGPACTIQAPKHPNTELRATQCNDYAVTSYAENISATLVRNAVQYRYRLYNVGQSYDYSVDKNANYFRLTDFPGLVPGETYSVQVAVKMPNQPDFGSFSKTCSIVVPMVARAVETSAERMAFEATVYPNPFAEHCYFKVNSASTEDYTIQVYDMLGKLVETKTVSSDSVESTEVGANFPAGVYNVIVTQGENIKTLRVIKR